MTDETEEKALVKVQDNIFTKIRRFIMQKFVKKTEEVKNINTEEKIEEENEKKETPQEIYEEKEELEKKLMNYYESIKKGI